MAKYGNKKCIKFTQDVGVVVYEPGYGLYASTPLSFSAGTFGNGGGASEYEFSYSFWIKQDWMDSPAGIGTIYSIDRTLPILRNHTSITLDNNPSSPAGRRLEISVRNNSNDDIGIGQWRGDNNPALNTREEWLHCVITFDGDLSTSNAGMISYLNSISASAGLWTTASVGDVFPGPVDGEGDPLTAFNTTFNFQGLGVDRPNNTDPGLNAHRKLNAKVANFAIWNKKLIQGEVDELYNDGRLLDLNASSMATNLVQWNKCGNYYDDVNPASISATTTASFNVADHASAPSPSGNLDRILGNGYGPTYKPEIVDDPVSTDMVFMDGFDNYSPNDGGGSISVLGNTMGLGGWKNASSFDDFTLYSGNYPGGICGTTGVSHFPPKTVFPSYFSTSDSRFLMVKGDDDSPSKHDNIDEMYHTFDKVTSGTVNIGFAYWASDEESQGGDGPGDIAGFYWGDSAQPNPSSSLEDGRLCLKFMGGTDSSMGWEPQLRRALPGDDIEIYTLLDSGPRGTFKTGSVGYPCGLQAGYAYRYWYWVEAEIYPAPTGTFKLFVNNSPTPVIDYTGDTRGVGSSSAIDFLGFRFTTNAGGGASGRYFLDDITAFHNKKAVEQYCIIIRPDTENFTGSFTTGAISGVPKAADCVSSINGGLTGDSGGGSGYVQATGTFMVTTSDPDSASFNYEDPAFSSDNISGIKIHNVINMDGIDFTSIQNNVFTSSVQLITGAYTVQPIPGTWEMVSDLYSWHPTSSVNTSKEFSSVDLNAIIDELKVK